MIRNEMQRRILMTTVGVIIIGLSVGLFKHSMLGVDPFQSFILGVYSLFDIGYGTFYTILNLIMLVFIFFIDRSKIGFGTLANIFLLGYIIQFSSWGMEVLFPDPNIVARVIMLIVGIVVQCFGGSLFLTGALGVSTYDAIALLMSEKGVAKFQYCRIGTDVTSVAVGGALGAPVGIGTVITAFFTGPLLVWFNTKIAEPFRYGQSHRKKDA